MSVISVPQAFNEDELYVDLRSIFGRSLFLKCEGFNFAGSYSLEELELLHLGPESLKRRVRSLNADLLLESRPGRGASLKVRIPPQ